MHDPLFDPENITGKYVLDDDGEPRPEGHLLKWADWFETFDRQLLADRIGQTRISTIFLALDMSHQRMLGDADAPPLLWETMVFGPSPFHHHQWRYATKLDALRGHVIACALVERFGDPPRRTKKALRKFRDGKRLRSREAQRTWRWLARVRAYEHRRRAACDPDVNGVHNW